jgi:glucosylceramidase
MNGLVNGSDSGARIKDDEATLTAYALYFARFVEEYAKENIKIESVQPQNEPGYATRYPSCLWTPALLRDFVRDYLGPTLEERGLDTEIWLGTMSAPEDTAHVQSVMGDAEAAKYIKGIGLQWNTMGSVGGYASQYQVPVMQTEHKCGNYPWEMASFNPDRPPNDHAYAEESWGLIRDWIKAGVHSYSAWNMVLDTQGQNLDVERPWPQNALLTVDRGSRELAVTPAYYVFRHLSYFVDPGATRIGTTGNTDALAFENPDGSLIAVLYNSGQARQMTLGVAGTTLQFDMPGRGWATVNWQPNAAP